MELKQEDIENLKGLFQDSLKEDEKPSTNLIKETGEEIVKTEKKHPNNSSLDTSQEHIIKLNKLDRFVTTTIRLQRKKNVAMDNLFREYQILLNETIYAHDQLNSSQSNYKFIDVRRLRIKRIEDKFIKWYNSNKSKKFPELENTKVTANHSKLGNINHYDELKWVLKRKLSKLGDYITKNSVKSLIMSELDELFNDVVCHFDKVKVNISFQEAEIEKEITRFNLLKKAYYDIKVNPSLISGFSTVYTSENNVTNIRKILEIPLYFTSSKYFIKIYRDGDIQCIGKKIHRFPFISKQWQKTEGDIVKYILCRCKITEIERCMESDFLSAEKIFSESKIPLSKPLIINQNLTSKGQSKSQNITQQERKITVITLHWVAVFFGQKYIRVFYKDVWHRFEYEQSRPDFESYKHLLRLGQFGFLTLEVDLLDHKPIKVHNLNILDTLFDRLEIEHLLTNTELGRIQYLIQLNGESWTNERIQQAYKLRDRTPYLTHLCQIFDSSLKIIPIREIRSHDSTDSVLEEDAFLFPMTKGSRVYIFWESVELENRSTHIFWCPAVNYREGLQRVFDYIANPGITNKRQKLRSTRMDYFQQGEASYVGSVNHIAFDDWKQRIHQICI